MAEGLELWLVPWLAVTVQLWSVSEKVHRRKQKAPEPHTHPGCHHNTPLRPGHHDLDGAWLPPHNLKMATLFDQPRDGTLFLGGQKISGSDIRDQNGSLPPPAQELPVR